MVDMVKKGVFQSVLKYQKDLAKVMSEKKALGAEFDVTMESSLLEKISKLSASIYKNLEVLENSIVEAKNHDSDAYEEAKYYREVVFDNMNVLRTVVDEAEAIVGKDYWAYPTYEEILYSVL